MTAPVVPLTIGPKNAELVTGQPWRWVRDTARRLGVPVRRTGGKPWIEPAQWLEAVRADAAPVDAAPEVDERDELEAMRRRFGKVRRTA
jgi:hypothetical protein